MRPLTINLSEGSKRPHFSDEDISIDELRGNGAAVGVSASAFGKMLREARVISTFDLRDPAEVARARSIGRRLGRRKSRRS
jgi:hypothetical protein